MENEITTLTPQLVYQLDILAQGVFLEPALLPEGYISVTQLYEQKIKPIGQEVLGEDFESVIAWDEKDGPIPQDQERLSAHLIRKIAGAIWDEYFNSKKLQDKKLNIASIEEVVQNYEDALESHQEGLEVSGLSDPDTKQRIHNQLRQSLNQLRAYNNMSEAEQQLLADTFAVHISEDPLTSLPQIAETLQDYYHQGGSVTSLAHTQQDEKVLHPLDVAEILKGPIEAASAHPEISSRKAAIIQLLPSSADENTINSLLSLELSGITSESGQARMSRLYTNQGLDTPDARTLRERVLAEHNVVVPNFASLSDEDIEVISDRISEKPSEVQSIIQEYLTSKNIDPDTSEVLGRQMSQELENRKYSESTISQVLNGSTDPIELIGDLPTFAATVAAKIATETESVTPTQKQFITATVMDIFEKNPQATELEIKQRLNQNPNLGKDGSQVVDKIATDVSLAKVKYESASSGLSPAQQVAQIAAIGTAVVATKNISDYLKIEHGLSSTQATESAKQLVSLARSGHTEIVSAQVAALTTETPLVATTAQTSEISRLVNTKNAPELKNYLARTNRLSENDAEILAQNLLSSNETQPEKLTQTAQIFTKGVASRQAVIAAAAQIKLNDTQLQDLNTRVTKELEKNPSASIQEVRSIIAQNPSLSAAEITQLSKSVDIARQKVAPTISTYIPNQSAQIDKYIKSNDTAGLTQHFVSTNQLPADQASKLAQVLTEASKSGKPSKELGQMAKSAIAASAAAAGVASLSGQFSAPVQQHLNTNVVDFVTKNPQATDAQIKSIINQAPSITPDQSDHILSTIKSWQSAQIAPLKSSENKYTFLTKAQKQELGTFISNNSHLSQEELSTRIGEKLGQMNLPVSESYRSRLATKLSVLPSTPLSKEAAQSTLSDVVGTTKNTPFNQLMNTFSRGNLSSTPTKILTQAGISKESAAAILNTAPVVLAHIGLTGNKAQTSAAQRDALKDTIRALDPKANLSDKNLEALRRHLVIPANLKELDPKHALKLADAYNTFSPTNQKILDRIFQQPQYAAAALTGIFKDKAVADAFVKERLHLATDIITHHASRVKTSTGELLTTPERQLEHFRAALDTNLQYLKSRSPKLATKIDTVRNSLASANMQIINNVVGATGKTNPSMYGDIKKINSIFTNPKEYFSYLVNNIRLQTAPQLFQTIQAAYTAPTLRYVSQQQLSTSPQTLSSFTSHFNIRSISELKSRFNSFNNISAFKKAATFHNSITNSRVAARLKTAFANTVGKTAAGKALGTVGGKILGAILGVGSLGVGLALMLGDKFLSRFKIYNDAKLAAKKGIKYGLTSLGGLVAGIAAIGIAAANVLISAIASLAATATLAAFTLVTVGPFVVIMTLLIINNSALIVPTSFGVVGEAGVGAEFPAGPGGLYPKCFPFGKDANSGRVTQGPVGYGGTSHEANPARGYAGENALDFSLVDGTPIFATHDGLALAKDNGGGYGYHVTLSSPAGFSTIYAHLKRSTPVLAPGTSIEVKAGSLIGYADNSGNSTGSHLHYELIGGGGINVQNIVPPGHPVNPPRQPWVQYNAHDQVGACYANESGGGNQPI